MIFSLVGSPNPQIDLMVKVDFWLWRQLSKYHNEDLSPTHILPILLSLLLNLYSS